LGDLELKKQNAISGYNVEEANRRYKQREAADTQEYANRVESRDKGDANQEIAVDKVNKLNQIRAQYLVDKGMTHISAWDAVNKRVNSIINNDNIANFIENKYNIAQNQEKNARVSNNWLDKNETFDSSLYADIANSLNIDGNTALNPELVNTVLEKSPNMPETLKKWWVYAGEHGLPLAWIYDKDYKYHEDRIYQASNLAAYQNVTNDANYRRNQGMISLNKKGDAIKR
jgi:hypothetical protein